MNNNCLRVMKKELVDQKALTEAVKADGALYQASLEEANNEILELKQKFNSAADTIEKLNQEIAYMQPGLGKF